MSKRIITEIHVNQTPAILQPKIKVCAYVRISTEHFGQLNSLHNQTEYYERKLKSTPAYEYCGVYSDAGISGYKGNRPGFMAMMEKARNGEINLIFTKSISRFARNTVLLLESIRELRSLGVGVIFEEQNINTLTAEGEFILTVLGSIAEEERKAVSSNVRWAMQNKFKRGEALVNADQLLGYDRDENGELVINKEQAKTVRRIFKLYLEGASGYAIAKEFNQKNIPAYTKYPWSSQRILNIISNEKYVGDCLMQKCYISDDGMEKINRGQKAKYYVNNDHPPIVSRTVWEAAQKTRETRKRKEYPFTGLLICPYCGATLIRVRHERKWVSWICGTYMQKGKSACVGMRIPEGILHELMKDMSITEHMVLEGVNNIEGRKKRTAKDYRLIPASEYKNSRGN